MTEGEGKPNPKSKGTFTPSKPKGGSSRSVRRLLKKLTGVRLQEFIAWGENVPSHHTKGRRHDPYKKKLKARRKMRLRMTKASRRINRSRR